MAGDGEEETWDDWVEEERGMRELFGLDSVSSLKECLDKASGQGFDLSAYCASAGADFYAKIRLVNYIRRQVAEQLAGGDSRSLSAAQITELVATITPEAEFWKDKSLLKPVVENDPLLHEMADDDDFTDSDSDGAERKDSVVPEEGVEDSKAVKRLARQNEGLKAQIAALQEQLAHAGRTVARLTEVQDGGDEAVAGAGAGAGNCAEPELGEGQDIDTYYFNSYAHIGIHEEMLKDKHRTESYRDAIERNAHLFKGKVVLDVGCGTGILSMFAARAGAKRVIAVDNSDIIHKARAIVKENGFEDVITLLQGKVEQVKLPVAEVDIIISEWMGYALLYESMLEAVLFARSWLSEGGHILPDTCRIYLEVMDDSEFWHSKQTFWKDVYGFNMQVMMPIALHEAIVDVVPSDSISSDRCEYKVLDLKTVTEAELDFESTFKMTVPKAGTCHGIVMSFDTDFFGTGSSVKPKVGSAVTVTLSTKTNTVPTHWKQTLLLLKEPFEHEAGAEISGVLRMARDEDNRRQYRFNLTITSPHTLVQDYFMS